MVTTAYPFYQGTAVFVNNFIPSKSISKQSEANTRLFPSKNLDFKVGLMMEDATLLEKTKSRLLGLRKLKNLATEHILRNLDALTQKKGEASIQNVLSPDMRENVLQELLRTRRPGRVKTIGEFKSMKQSVLVLLNTRTHKLDLDSLMSFYPEGLNSKDEFFEVLMMISLAAPNMRHLKMNIKDLNDCFTCDLLKNACIRYLRVLKELKILEIVGSASHEVDVAQLCKALPDLRVLGANNICLDISKISEKEIRESFGHLSLVEHDFMSDRNFCQIWKVLPNLDIVRNIGGNGLNLEDFVEDENLLTRKRKYLDFNDIFMNSNDCADVDLSCIRHLKFIYEENWNMLEKTLKGTTRLKSLNLTLTKLNDSETVDDIWLKIGANLRWLSISVSGLGLPIVQLNRISELCPKLEVLHLSKVNVTVNSSQPTKFFNLEELVFEQTECKTGECLTTLFSSARNLQTVILNTSQHNLEDLQQAKKLLIEKKILSSLKSLEWKIKLSTPDRVYKEIAAIMKNAAAVLPELRKLKFSYQRKCRYDNLNPPKRVDKNLNEILKLFK